MTGKQETDNQSLNILINTCVLIPPTIVSIVYPEIGKIAGFLGSFSALACIYVLPTVTFLNLKYNEIHNFILARAIVENRFSYIGQMDASVKTSASKSS